MIVSPAKAYEHIVACMKNNLPPMLAGPPGTGKSDIIRSIAKAYELELIDIRLSQCDPLDLNGFPAIKEGIASFVPMDTFPLATTPIPKGKTGFLVFLDEFNSASLAVQAASYRLVLDRQVGQHALHPKARIVCAGNLNTDGAIVNRVGTAMQSRLIHLELGVDHEQWIAWASKNDIDHRIIAYIHGRPENLHKFDPKHHDKTFACPRTWSFASKLIKNHTGNLMDLVALLAGTVSEAVAREFITYTSIYTNLPTMAEIIKNPLKAPLDRGESSIMYAIAHMLAAYTKQATLKPVMEYTGRMPLEFETIALQGIIRRDPEILKEEGIRDWTMLNGADLFL